MVVHCAQEKDERVRSGPSSLLANEPFDPMKHLPAVLFALVVSFGLFAWAGCDSIGTSSDAPPSEETDSPAFSVRLTDAPGDILEAVVTIKRVSVVPVEDSGNGDAREGGIELLTDSAFTADLTKLQAGVDTALASIDSMPTGTYSQIRLVTADTAHVLYESASGDSAKADLKQPSAAESGLKINFDPVTLDSGDRAEVTLDFSVEDSFVKAGRSGKYIFKPVIQTDSVVVDTSGS